MLYDKMDETLVLRQRQRNVFGSRLWKLFILSFHDIRDGVMGM